MSRIGKQIIQIPEDVSVKMDGLNCAVSGPKGELIQMMPDGVSIKIEQNVAVVSRDGDSRLERSAHGLARTLIQNMVIGVSAGYTKQLEIQGVGYRALLNGNDLTLSLGFSHPINLSAPDGITFKVDKNIISISGIDKTRVGEMSAIIRGHRKPEPYKGKGIRYIGEHVRRKVGKAAKA